RAWDVAVSRTAAQPPRPESCGGALGTPARMAADRVTEVTGRS
ncbi:MAG: sucrase ferredoxin, partial [Streptomyces sp.]|nr:sucrase ferredoxin [Streptomyces sp.]